MTTGTFDTLRVFTDALGDHGDRPAMLAMRKDDVQSVAYDELVDQLSRVAAGLAELGTERGENVAILAENNPGWVATCLGMIRCGVVPVPVDVQMPRDALTHVLGDSEVRYVVTTRDLAEQLGDLDLEQKPTPILLDEDAKDAPSGEGLTLARLLAAEPGAAPAPPDEEDIAVLFYTSGTTGKPKGVPLTHRNLAFQLNAVRDAHLVSEDDRGLLPLPLHHVYPFVLGLLAPLSVGMPIVIPRSLTGPQIVRAMREGEATLIIGVPRLYRALVSGIGSRVASMGRVAEGVYRAASGTSTALRRRMGVRTGQKLLQPVRNRFAPSLRMVTSGGSPLPAKLAWELEGFGWQVVTGYGLTETSPLLTWNLPGDAKFDSAGRPVKGVELRIDPDAAPEGSETSANGQTVGEVLARGPGVFKGYRNLPDKTEESFSGEWFRTGDVGYFDEDGFLHIIGRASTMIVTESGENIQPDDLEETYSEHPALREVGVLQRDSQLVTLIVPSKQGDAEEVEGSVREAIDEIAREIPSYQRIGDYAITREPLPRTRIGKIRRDQLEERYDKARAGEEESEQRQAPMDPEQMASQDRSLLSDPAARQVWDWLVERYPDYPLTPDSSPQLDLGIDSMAWLDLTLEVGERAGVELEEEALDRIETVRDLLEEVAGASGGEQAAPLEEPEETLSDKQKAWLEPLGGGRAALATGLFAANRVMMRSAFRVRARGVERLPEQPPFVLASNHVSILDPAAIAAALPDALRKETYWGGWTGKTMTNPVKRFLSRLAQTVPLDPKRAAISSLAFGAAVLKRNQALVWFPEGQRSADGQLQPFRQGLGRLLEHYPAPVVPVAIHGGHEAMPPGQKIPRPTRIHVTFGEPLDPRELEREGEGDDSASRMMHALNRRVADLLADQPE